MDNIVAEPAAAPITPAPAAPAPVEVAPVAAPVAVPMTLAQAKAALSTPPSPQGDVGITPESADSIAGDVTPPAVTSDPPQDPAPGLESHATGENTVTPGEPTAPDLPAEFQNLPEGWEVREVPEGHFYRDRGKTHVPVPPGWENEFNAFLNDPVRRATVDQASRDLSETRQTAERWQATAEHFMERAMALASDPSVAMSVAQIRDGQGDEAAQTFLAGLFEQDSEALQSKLSEVQQTSQQAAQEREADNVISGMTRVIQTVDPSIPVSAQQDLMRGFAALLNANVVKPTKTDFTRYLQQQGVGAAPAPPAPTADELKAQIREELRLEAEAAQRDHVARQRLNPLAGTAPLPAGTMAVPGNDGPTTIDEARKALTARR